MLVFQFEIHQEDHIERVKKKRVNYEYKCLATALNNAYRAKTSVCINAYKNQKRKKKSRIWGFKKLIFYQMEKRRRSRRRKSRTDCEIGSLLLPLGCIS